MGIFLAMQGTLTELPRVAYWLPTWWLSPWMRAMVCRLLYSRDWVICCLSSELTDGLLCSCFRLRVAADYVEIRPNMEAIRSMNATGEQYGYVSTRVPCWYSSILRDLRRRRHYLELWPGKPCIAGLGGTCFILVSSLSCSSILKMKTTCYSETSVHFQRTNTALYPKRYKSP
jgi:hypothetical protein